MRPDTNAGTSPVDLKPTFAPLVTACNAHGIGRTKAFELAAAGIIETFAVGTRRFVVLESLRTLPDRLREKAA
ncbi:hypothetical protein [Dokdonella sp.]|uniref:hypothetical protein n=1 Tax=Dokdonella sp. TaxID=2291710 RepID=UPI0035285CB7